MSSPSDPLRGDVLVVDDDPIICMAVARLLGGLHRVATETDPDAALARVARGERFDVVLCDIAMPRRDGLQFVEAVAAIAPELAARTVFVTATHEGDAVRREIAARGFTVVQKPFRAAPLRALVAVRVSAVRGGGGER